MKLTLLGTGTPTPSTVRSGSSYLLETADDTVLFDCGPGSYFRYLQTGRELTQISHIVFSHLHYDHCADFAAIALARWDQSGGRVPDLTVIGPPGIKAFVDKIVGPEGAFAPDQDARTNHPGSIAYYHLRGGKGDRPRIAPTVIEIAAKGAYEGPDWSLQCVEVPHVQPYLTCQAYRLDHAGKAFCYSGDASYSKAFVRMASGCDVMVHMCHRISGTQLHPAALTVSAAHLDVARIAEEAGARTCVFTHINAQMDVPGVPERLLQQIGEVYKGHAIWGNDLMQIGFEPPAAGAIV